jgi:hypothetical protein
MSDPTYNTPIYERQGGAQLNVDSGGTLQVLSGGSIQVASGGRVDVASGGSIQIASGGRLEVASGGTIQFGASSLGAVAYGSVVLTNGGSATVGVGFPIRGVAPIIVALDGSISGVAVNTSLYASGSAILYGMSGTLITTIQRGTVGYTVFG